MRALAGQMLRFGVVGTVAFLIDAGTLWLLMGAGVGPYAARLAAFVPAFLANFALNRAWTFRAGGARTAYRRQMGGYLAVQLIGLTINYAAFAAVIAIVGQSRTVAMVAVAVGSIAAMAFNFASARLLVFRKPA